MQSDSLVLERSISSNRGAWDVEGRVATVAGASVRLHNREVAIIRAAMRCDKRAQRLFVAKYGRLIFHFIIKTGVTEHSVEDLYQTVFLRLWERNCRVLRNWSGKGTFSSYLSTAVKRMVYNEIRPRAIDTCTVSMAGAEVSDLTAPSPETIVEQRYLTSAVSHAITSMKPSDARLMIYRHIDGLSYDEIGTKLDMPINSVGSALFRGTRRMRQKLEVELS